ncbi:hypothetical protein [Naasia sp. SYSU D00948]|uniref:hypothetical protein n=1 Tax=Naasia sp. SYSU D00948 TaxID=2817379 RepID=UPI001B31816B|nr:hypothetical protein [Naasia sp. SYSU D00948]
MPAVAAVLFCVILAALAVFQIALIAGAPLGHLAWGGQDRVLPRQKRIGSVVSIVLYAAFALLALERVGLLDLLPSAVDPVVRVLMWIVFAYLVLGIPLNLISRSKPERYVMTPVATVLAVLALLVALA